MSLSAKSIKESCDAPIRATGHPGYNHLFCTAELIYEPPTQNKRHFITLLAREDD